MRKPDFASLKPVLGRKIDALEHAWLTAKADERAEIEVILELLRRQQTTQRSVLLQPPEDNQADGPIRLGRIVHGKKELGWLGITERELTQHVAVTGRSGSGKSTLCVRILLQLMEREIPWLVFDYKRSARALQGIEAGRDVQVIALGRDIGSTMSFNIMVPPPGLTPDVHQRRLVELIADCWYAGDGVISLLERSMSEAYAACAPQWPTIADVKTILEDAPAKSREMLWKTSAMRILQQLTTGQLGRILNTRRDAAALDRLRRSHTIIECDGLSTNDANFLTQHIVHHLAQHLLAEPAREELRFVCMIEEAHHLLAKREGGRETLLETALREGREVGLGIMLADQCISAISPTALANCFTTICLNVRQRTDVNAASGSLLLNEEQRELLSVLPVGEAIVRLSDRWPYPVHIRIPRLDLPKGSVIDTEVRHAFLQGPFNNAALEQQRIAHPATAGDSAASSDLTSNTRGADASPAVSARPLASKESATTHSSRNKHSTFPHPSPQQAPRPPPLEATTPNHDDADSYGVSILDRGPESGSSRLLLQSVAAEPLLGVAARFDAIGLSRRKGTAIKQALIDEGYLRPIEMPIPAGKVVLLELTDQARLWLTRHRIAIAPINGSLPHAWWQAKAAALLQDAGWTVSLEHQPNGHRFDLFAERDGRSLLLEIETGRSDWLGNLGHLEAATAHLKAVLWLDAGSLLRAKAALPAGVALLQPREVEGWIAG